MMEIDDLPSCARAEDLVTYLYGEADAVAAQNFEAHTQRCASCRSELAQFRQVRSSVGEWREQALGSHALETIETSSPVIVEQVGDAIQGRRSALAAIREFFSLSPVWLRAATAAMGIVFCALIALAVVHHFEQPQTISVERVVQVQPSEEDLARMVAERIKQQGETIRPVQQDISPAPRIEKAAATPDDSVPPGVNRGLRQDAVKQRNLARTPAAPRLKVSPQESREIARDLRLTIASNDEDDLTRLSDLLEEFN